MTDDEWESAISASSGDLLINLIKERTCPSYTIQSIGIAGRCVPDFGLIQDSAENSNMTDANDNPISKWGADGEGTLNMQDIFDSIKSIIDILNLQQFAERIFSDFAKYWTMLLVGVAISKICNLSLSFPNGFYLLNSRTYQASKCPTGITNAVIIFWLFFGACLLTPGSRLT